MSGVRQTHRGPEAARRSPAPSARRAPVARRPAYLQSKMAVSRPGDAQEQEADQVATQVARSPRAGSLQRAGLAPGPEREEQTLAPAAVAAARNIHRQAAGEEEPLQTRLQRQEEEEPLQTRLARQAAEEEEPVQTRLWRKAAEEEEPLQTLRRQAAGEEEEPIQARLARKAAPVAGSTLDPETEQRIESRRGMGEPLPEDVRVDIETRFGHDFSGVRVHTDAEAADLATKLGARAFTVGSDVFFAAGEYAPETDAGRELLAHELTHVVQQGSGAARMVMRSNGSGTGTPSAPPAAGTPPPVDFTLSDGTFIERTARTYPGSTRPRKRMNLPAISLPDFKERNHARFPNVLALRPHARGNTQQGSLWRESVRGQVERLLEPKLQNVRIAGGYARDQDFYFLRGKQNPDFVLFGNREELLERAMVPFWDADARPSTYQIDHVVEDQLVNPDDSSLTGLTSTDRASNFELLEAEANGSSGRLLATEINSRLRTAVRLFAEEHPAERPIEYDAVRHGGYYVNFLSHTFDLGGTAGEPHNFWPHRDVLRGRPLDALEPMTGDQMRDLNREDEPAIFTSPQGGALRHVRLSELPIQRWLPRVDLTAVELNENPSTQDVAGWLTVDAYRTSEARDGFVESSYPEMRWRLRPVPGIYGGAVDAEYVKENYFGARTSLRLPGLSPIEFETFSISDAGVRAEGRVLPTVPLIGDADIRILVAGGEVQLRKTFETGELSVPPPFEVSNTSLTVFLGTTTGLGIEGRADFGIQNLGEGHLEAAASTGGGFALEGAFDFDTELFDPARVEMSYRDEQLSVSGEIGIPRGKVPGIASATVTASYTEGEGFTATGEATLDIPGVEQGTLTISQSEEEGFSIGGTFQLGGDIPGIRGGSIEATLRERPDGEGYSVSASGEAQPDIPGFDSSLAISYQDGAITLEATAAYQRGLLSGQVRFGATNRTLDAEGNPTGEPGDSLIAYGGGQVTLQIAPWLQGTAGIEFAPDGEVTVAGEIGLPDQIEIFPRKEIRKDILSIDIPIPIVPGIFAEVGGGLDAHAGIGPGVIDQLRLGVEYTPSREQDTRVTGDAHLNVPADAGLRLSVRAGIGLGIPAASVSGGLEIGGELGLEGAAEAGVHIDWMPSTGLEIDAFGRLSAQPRFTFDISGYVEVEALFFTIYEERWELASYELGSNLTFGVRFPIHYKEGEPFDISLDDVEFEVPDVNPRQILGDLMDAIA